MAIHPTAVIDPDAAIGQDVDIGPFSVIEADTSIGDRCRLLGGVTVRRYTEIGEGTEIHTGAVLGGTPQDVAFAPDTVSRVRIGRDCRIREGVTVHRGTGADTETVVGDGCFLMANSHVGHNARVGSGVILVNGALLAGHVEVGDRALISGNAVVHQFCRIGRLAILSGLAGVSKDLPPFFMVHAAAPNRVAAINTVGLRRAGFAAAERTAVKRAFRLLYRSGLTVTEAVAAMRAELDSDAVRELSDFIETSKRGICSYIREAAGGDEADAER